MPLSRTATMQYVTSEAIKAIIWLSPVEKVSQANTYFSNSRFTEFVTFPLEDCLLKGNMTWKHLH